MMRLTTAFQAPRSRDRLKSTRESLDISSSEIILTHCPEW